jgi:hypothetical protein
MSGEIRSPLSQSQRIIDNQARREISTRFMAGLRPDGKLAPLTRKINKDDTLLLALRGTSVNVCYRCVNSVLRKPIRSYIASFDENYGKVPQSSQPSSDCKQHGALCRMGERATHLESNHG